MTQPTYRNPIARDGDFADPFVLRHNGRYYLYATNPDVRCWSSADLVRWTLEGPTIGPEVFADLVPFAPEVVYAEGAFYMYTSPSGHGHYVLRADTPTGPFEPVTGNVGHAIDGNVFVDDDGRRYFYWAADEGIWGCEMPSPTEFGEPVFTGIHMNGWTEGPFVSKGDGVYQMTLTGNHYLSRGYRVDAATSEDPLRGFRAAALNPILVGADGPATGLGHSSSVVGPDLVSTWIVYHNINPDASRDLDIDRQVGVGRSLMVLGPTTTAPAPSGPDVVWTEGDDRPTVPSGPFTAELNLTASAGTRGYGIRLGADLAVRVDVAHATVTATGPDGAVVTRLPSGFRHDTLHCWRLEHDDGPLLGVRLDGRLQHRVRFEPAADAVFSPFAEGGALGVGSCALTRSTGARADREAVKPVPGRFWAGSGLAGERLSPGTVLAHELFVQRAGQVRVHLAGRFAAGDRVAVSIDGDESAVLVDRSTRLAAATLSLPAGARRLTLRGLVGDPVVQLVSVLPAPPARPVSCSDEELSGWGKRVLASGLWDDVEVTAFVTVRFDAPGGHADVLLRAGQLAEGGEGADTRLGIDFFLGYSVQLHPDRVVLARHDYDTTVLGSAPAALGRGGHALVIQVAGSELAVEIDGREVLRGDDELPHPAGAVGLRVADAQIRVATLVVVPRGPRQKTTDRA